MKWWEYKLKKGLQWTLGQRSAIKAGSLSEKKMNVWTQLGLTSIGVHDRDITKKSGIKCMQIVLFITR